MTGTPLGRKDRRLAAALAATSLVLAACGERPVAPPPVIVPSPPPTSPFQPPALTDDGNRFPKEPVAPSLLPRVEEGPVADRGPTDAWEPWPDDAREGADVDAFPDVAALLAGLAVETSSQGATLTFSGNDADAAGRAFAALDGAVNRRYRVEVRAVRTWPGRPAPSAATVLAEDGARVLVGFDGILRDGALAVAAPRQEATFPADVDLENVTAHSVPSRFGIGAALSVSPARVDRGRALLRIAVHSTRIVGERRIAGDDVERVAPLLAMTAFAGEVAAANGVATAVVADSGDPETSFVLAWRVTAVTEPAPTPGALALSLHADRPLVQLVAPPLPGRIGLPQETIDLDALAELEVPSDVPQSVRAVVVAPGVLVVTGSDAVLATLAGDAESSRATRLAPALFRLGRTSIPFVPARGAVLVQGRVLPFTDDPDIDIAQESCSAAMRTRWLFHGRSVRIVPESGGAVAEIDASPEATITPGDARITRSDDDGERVTRDVLDVVHLRTTSRRVVLRAGHAADDDATLEAVSW